MNLSAATTTLREGIREMRLPHSLATTEENRCTDGHPVIDSSQLDVLTFNIESNLFATLSLPS